MIFRSRTASLLPKRLHLLSHQFVFFVVDAATDHTQLGDADQPGFPTFDHPATGSLS